MAAAVSLFAADVNDELQYKLLRRFLQLIAIATLLIAMSTMLAGTELFLPRWPILVMLAIYLWVTTGSQDLRDWITSVHIASADPISGHFGSGHFDSGLATEEFTDLPVGAEKTGPAKTATTHSPWVSEMIESVQMRRKRKRAVAVMRREQEEARDQARLDQVLKIVSERGTRGLSAKDKALLQRVSENLRRNRKPDDEA